METNQSVQLIQLSATGFIKNHGGLLFTFRAFNVIVCIMVNLNIFSVIKI